MLRLAELETFSGGVGWVAGGGWLSEMKIRLTYPSWAATWAKLGNNHIIIARTRTSIHIRERIGEVARGFEDWLW